MTTLPRLLNYQHGPRRLADVSLVESRVLAHAENFLIADFWRSLAAEVYGVPPDEVTEEQRRAAKAAFYERAWS